MVDSVLPWGTYAVCDRIAVVERACSVYVYALLSVTFAEVGFEKLECTSFKVELLFEFADQFYVTDCVKGSTEREMKRETRDNLQHLHVASVDRVERAGRNQNTRSLAWGNLELQRLFQVASPGNPSSLFCHPFLFLDFFY